MVLSTLFKPRSIALSEGIRAMKSPKKCTVFLKVISDGASGEVVKWFRGQVFDYRWESYLYPDKANTTPERRSSILAISAGSKAELSSRVARLMGEAPGSLEIAVLDDPLTVAESCSQLLALAAQREGGLH